jgi:hypothetical protein
MTNFARWSLVLVLRAIFGGTKSRALVNVFMISPLGLVASRHDQILPLDHGRLMAIKPRDQPASSGPNRRGEEEFFWTPLRLQRRVWRVMTATTPTKKQNGLRPSSELQHAVESTGRDLSRRNGTLRRKIGRPREKGRQRLGSAVMRGLNDSGITLSTKLRLASRVDVHKRS